MTTGLPWVNVPVLSNTTVFTCESIKLGMLWCALNRVQFQHAWTISLLKGWSKCTIRLCRTLCVVSSGSPPLMRMPFCAPTPVPTITAVGVARPRAQGHAISSTAIACTNALLISKQGLGTSCGRFEELVLLRGKVTLRLQ